MATSTTLTLATPMQQTNISLAGISLRRRLRIQIETDLAPRPPAHQLPIWITAYEIEDRTKPSISSF